MRTTHLCMGTAALALFAGCAVGTDVSPADRPTGESAGGPGASAGGTSILGGPSSTGGMPGTGDDDGGAGVNPGGDAAAIEDATPSARDATTSRSDGAAVTLPPPVPCAAGSIIEAVSTGAYYSWPGTVYASAPIAAGGRTPTQGS